MPAAHLHPRGPSKPSSEQGNGEAVNPGPCPLGPLSPFSGGSFLLHCGGSFILLSQALTHRDLRCWGQKEGIQEDELAALRIKGCNPELQHSDKLSGSLVTCMARIR